MSQSPIEPHIGANKLARSGDYGLRVGLAYHLPSVGQSEIRPKDVGIPKHTDLFAIVLTTPQRKNNEEGLLHN